MARLPFMQEANNVSITSLLKEKIEKKIDSWSADLEAAEVKAKAKEAKAESDVADAQLEQEVLGKIGELKDKIAEARNYLDELLDAGDDRARELEEKVSRLDE